MKNNFLDNITLYCKVGSKTNSIDITIECEYSAISKALTQSLSKTGIHIGAIHMVVKKVQVSSWGAYLAITIQSIINNGVGELLFTGAPHINESEQKLYFSDMKCTAPQGNFVFKTAFYILRPTILSFINRHSNIDLQAVFRQHKSVIEAKIQASMSDSDLLTLESEIALQLLSIKSLQLTSDKLVATGRAILNPPKLLY